MVQGIIAAQPRSFLPERSGIGVRDQWAANETLLTSERISMLTRPEMVIIPRADHPR